MSGKDIAQKPLVTPSQTWLSWANVSCSNGLHALCWRCEKRIAANLFQICFNTSAASLEVKRTAFHWLFFSDSNFKATLDAKMKRLQSAGIWSKTRHCQAEVLMEDEKLLWQKGLLGDPTSQTLVDDTTVYMNSLYCFAKWQRIQTIEVYSLRS